MAIEHQQVNLEM